MSETFTNVLKCILPLLFCATAVALEVPLYDFPLSAYSQNIEDSFSLKDASKPLVSADYQTAQLKQFYTHYYASDSHGLSPWSGAMVSSMCALVPGMEVQILDEFNNKNKPHEAKHNAENFKEHDVVWWQKIKDNMNLSAMARIASKPENRAIAVANTYARVLPDRAPDFLHVSLPGQGFPFDNLQASAIWAGTPLYVLSVSQDKAWSLVFTPDGYFAWIQSQDLAYVSPSFIHRWQAAAKHGLLAVTKTNASILDSAHQFQFAGYLGHVFPLVARNPQETTFFIPVKNNHHQAMIKIGVIETDAARVMPVRASPQNMLKMIDELKNRPYGWGGSFFFNDCSQEMKSLFTPFGIWLPRNSGQQAQLSSTQDISTKTMNERLSVLKAQGHPWMTLIYIDGHVMLYLGHGHDGTALTYQNVWGLSSTHHDKRYVIGQSLFFPLRTQYPNMADVISSAGKAHFKLVYLDTLADPTDSPNAFARTFLAPVTREN